MNEESYRLSAKGWIRVFLMNNQNPDPEFFWSELTHFVSNQAKQDGLNGVPCLVLEGGGHCLTVNAIPK